MNPDYLDVAGAAAELGVGADCIYDLCRSGDIPARKVGKSWRLSKSAISEWLALRILAPTCLPESTNESHQ